MDMINSSPLDSLLDLDQIRADDCAALDYPGPSPRPNGGCVVVRQSMLNEVHRHGLGTTEIEICGVLVGNIYRDDRGPFVYVQASIRGEHAKSQNAQVTFTAATWNYVQEVLEREHQGARILGWYHTHPGFGIFLSGMDRFIHDHFFGGAEQLALVYDPLSQEQGLFVWRGGSPSAEEFGVEPDTPAEHPVRLVTGVRSAIADVPLTAGADATAGVAQLLQRVERLESRQKWLTWLTVIALGTATSVAGYLVAEFYLDRRNTDVPSQLEPRAKVIEPSVGPVVPAELSAHQSESSPHE